MTRRAHAASLPLDILDMILACSPDYATLASAVAVCKTFNRAFEGRAAGILRDIATHLYGGREELIHEAIRAICIENDVRNLNRWAKSDQSRFPSVLAAQFDDDALQQRPLTRNEAKELCKRVGDACALEVVFSLRHKDERTRGTSQLSDNESQNFHYALHRLEMVMSLSRRRHAGTYHWVGRENRYELFYRRFCSEAIFHIYELYSFLDKCVADIARYHLPPQHPTLSHPLAPELFNNERATIIIGTKNIMSVIRDPRTFKYPKSTYLRTTFCKADLTAFLWPKEQLPASIPPGTEMIVPMTTGTNIRCQTCQRRNGGALWNASNWHQLPEYFRLERLCDFFPQKLAKNEYERSCLLDFLHQQADGSSSITLEAILSDLFKKCPSLDATHETWMCARCLDVVLALRFWTWWASIKGETQEDCRYGFDCDMQIQRPGHAENYNHVCPNLHYAHKELKAAVGRALSAGRSARSALSELPYEGREELVWRAMLHPIHTNGMNIEDLEEQFGQQLQWALQKYEHDFHAKKARKATTSK